MVTLRLTRRDIAVVAVTTAVCFALAIPLTSASITQVQRQFTIWPGSSARFANLDLVCIYTENAPTVLCRRESVTSGPAMWVTPTHLRVLQCRPSWRPLCKRRVWSGVRTVAR